MKKITDTKRRGLRSRLHWDGMAVATHQVAVTEVSRNDKTKPKEVRLPRSVKPTDGERLAVIFADQHGGCW